jgi:hypothetical protein
VVKGPDNNFGMVRSAVMENLEKFRGAAVSAKYSYFSC